ncbi:class I SAM-dependent methyltransferase [Dokdonella sp.]|uniref:class I SAM-dependent methyltransferase n=1 Tax=Dokdonella sp. TaxID=2291710 RepID=UPI0031C39F87|nr:class I SAM-dependent methyltransferase [Dokdonella sp.]
MNRPQQTVPERPAAPAWPLRTVRQAGCPACGSAGCTLHPELADRLFGTPGNWCMRRCTERGCATAWLDPAPHPDDLWMAYQAYYTHDENQPPRLPGTLGQQVWAAWKLGYPMPEDGLARLAGAAMLLQPRRRDRALSARLYLPFVPGGRLLDIGCGSGGQLRAMRTLGWDALGLEPDAAALAAARQQGLEVHAGDLTTVRFEADSFDGLSMLHVIEHLPEPAWQLAECRRILRPGGRLLLVTPNVDALGHRWFGADWRGLEPPRHLQLYSPSALAQAVRAAGFEVEQVHSRAAGAARMLRISAQIRAARRRGQAHLDPRRRRLADLRWRLLGLLERSLVALGRPCGEEIVLLGRRPLRS